MAWGRAFKDALRSTNYQPTWLMQCLWSPLSAVGGDLYASHDGLGGTPGIVSPPRVSAASIQPQSWAPVYGSWSAQIDGHAPTMVLRAPKGSLVQLRMWPAGRSSDMEPVALGVVRAIGGNERVTTVQFWDLMTALKGRLTTDSSKLKLFYDAYGATVLAGDYTPGDGTIDLVDASVLQQGASGGGCIKVQAATPFYLTYTGVSTNQLTGVSAAGTFSTTESAALTGVTVSNVVWLTGHPFDIARQVLTSGGGGGDYDVLPDDWGIGLSTDLFDHDDCDLWEQKVQAATGSTSWDVLVDPSSSSYDGENDALSWLQGILSPAGLWIAQRQGRLTLRAGLNPYSLTEYSDTITESDVISWDWEAWDSSLQEYGGISVTSGSGGTTIPTVDSEGIRTAPAQAGYAYTLSWVHGNEPAQRAEVGDRLHFWVARPPERLILRCRGWRLSGLTPGDPVLLELPRLRGRLSAYNISYESWPAIVGAIAPDFGRCETRVEVWPRGEE